MRLFPAGVAPKLTTTAAALTMLAHGAAAQPMTTLEFEVGAGASSSGALPPETSQNVFDDINSKGPQSASRRADADGVWVGGLFNAFFSYKQSAFAAATGSVDFGTIRAKVQAQGTMEAGADCVIGVTGTGCALNPNTAQAQAIILAEAIDQITIRSATLPIGTPVNISYGLDLKATYQNSGNGTVIPCSSGPGGFNPSGYATLNASVLGTRNLPTLAALTGECTDPSRISAFADDLVADPKKGNQITVVADVDVGDTIEFAQIVDLAAEAGVAGEGTSASIITDFSDAGIDASNTSNMILNIDSPGAFYTSESGTKYLTTFPSETTSMPEPPTWAIFVIGISIIGLQSIGRRRNPSL